MLLTASCILERSNVFQQRDWKKMESTGRSLSTDEPDVVFDETTPLLNPCSSLPTVTSYETGQLDFPGPSTTQSEVGVKSSKRPRRRCVTQRSLETQKMRPYIASPFMPIATPLSIPLERRAPNSPKPSKKNTVLNGSAKPDEGLLAADERGLPATNDE
ncbi:unnamed protein product [Angiostrongylus costaricensis]|uniref:Uncharacterized protein n=1 Tax=Angiostrongylus costaricensis TaxID=334426 RepID=A0A0R3PE62_ANGCS|nr:unnamed protein product [Angiostrongylus costaricensis]